MGIAVPRHHFRRLAWVGLGIVATLPLTEALTRSFSPERVLEPGNVLQLLARASGALGEGLLGLIVVLGVRSPRLERLLGPLDRLVRVHHSVGVVAYLTVLLHPLVLAAAAESWRSASRQLFDVGRPGIALGWCGLALLMVVACASFLARLQHETWRRIHVLAWGVAAAAIGHGIAMRGISTADVVVATAILMGILERVRTTVKDSARYIVTEAKPLGGRITEVILEPLERPMRFDPGQFVFIRFYDPSTGWRCREYHPFTIASSPRESRLRVIIKERGDCSRVLVDLKADMLATIRGPFGSLFHPLGAARQVWLGGGVGIVPFLSAARALDDDAATIDLFYCTKRVADAVHLDELIGIAARHRSLHLHCHVDERDGPPQVAHVLSELGDVRDAEFFIAGPAGFTEALTVGLRAHDIASRQIHAERFDYL